MHRRTAAARNLLGIAALLGIAVATATCTHAQSTPSLAHLRHDLVGHDVYAYGQIGISCPPDWTRVYGQTVPLRIVAVEQERTGVFLGTGAQFGLDAYGASFYEPHPIRFVFAIPRKAPLGTNYRVNGVTGRCPALDLAAFQIPLAFSRNPPPPGALRGNLRIGMTRGDVIWHVGYPWELGDRRKLLAENLWAYGTGLGSYTITFRNERVASIQRSRARR
jgi:hypothetical protein